MMTYMCNALLVLAQSSRHHTGEQLHWSFPVWLPYMVNYVMLCAKAIAGSENQCSSTFLVINIVNYSRVHIQTFIWLI